jgi:hypothetical protein
MTQSTRLLVLAGVVSSLATARTSFAGNGVITPAKTSMTMTALYFIDMSNQTISAQAPTTTLSFQASTPDFQQLPFAVEIADAGAPSTSMSNEITVPEGRFVGLGLAVDNTQRKITLDGNYKYMGSDTNDPNIKSGYYLCTTGTATDGTGIMGSATKGNCTAPAELTVKSGSSSQTVVSGVYFANPVCITTPDRKASVCQSGDTFLDGSIPSNLKVTILFDLYNSITVANTDPNLGPNQPYKLMTGTYPFAVLGDPGAAVHLSLDSTLNGDGTPNTTGAHSVADVTILMDSTKKLVYTNATVFSDTQCKTPASGCSHNNVVGFCAGQSYRDVTSTPSGAAPNPWSDQVSQFDTSTGKVAFEASGYAVHSMMNPDPNGSGINLIGSIINLVYNKSAPPPAVAVNCVGDDDGASLMSWDPAFKPYLGYGYTAGKGNPYTAAPGYNPNFTLGKVVDPGNLLGTTGTACSGSTCGDYPQ